VGGVPQAEAARVGEETASGSHDNVRRVQIEDEGSQLNQVTRVGHRKKAHASHCRPQAVRTRGKARTRIAPTRSAVALLGAAQ